MYYYYSGTLFEIENRERDDWALLYAEYCIIGNPIVVYLVTPSLNSRLLSDSDHFYSCPARLLARPSPDYLSFFCDCQLLSV